jgi:hypothetical protein
MASDSADKTSYVYNSQLVGFNRAASKLPLCTISLMTAIATALLDPRFQP